MDRINAALVDASGNNYGIKQFDTIEELEAAERLVLTQTNGVLYYSYDGTTIKQCEMCDRLYHYKDSPQFEGDSRACRYCSYECTQEAEEETSFHKREAQEQYDMFGDDYDSWYS